MCEEHVWTNDTQENRFLKFALGQITDKYEVLKKRIKAVKNASDVMKDDMQATLTILKHLQRNPFFRTIGIPMSQYREKDRALPAIYVHRHNSLQESLLYSP